MTQTNVRNAAFFSQQNPDFSLETCILREFKEKIEEVHRKGKMTAFDFQSLYDFANDRCIPVSNRYPFDKICDKMKDIANKKNITQGDLDDFLQFCDKAFNPIKNSQDTFDYHISGKNIVLTGEFEIGSKKEIEIMLTRYGANVQDNVKKDTDIVIAGNKGNKFYNMGTYGSKVEKALALQRKGYPVQILKEEDVFDFTSSTVL